MKTNLLSLILSLAFTLGSASAQETYDYPSAKEKAAMRGSAHLFILSGQSNMAALDPGVSFTPAVIKTYGADKVIVVKDAKGGQSIQHWYKEWKSVQGKPSRFKGDLYDRLMSRVKPAIEGREILTVTFVWMQGERDAQGQVAVYRASLEGLLNQLKQDLKRDDINFVIGRLSDAGLERHPQWKTMRELQVAFAEASPRGAWVDTDDLNNKVDKKTGKLKNDVHYTRDGYKIFGERLAEKAIQLTEKSLAAETGK